MNIVLFFILTTLIITTSAYAFSIDTNTYLVGGQITLVNETHIINHTSFNFNNTADDDLNMMGFSVINNSWLNSSAAALSQLCINDVCYTTLAANSYNVTYDSKPSNTYNVTYDSKPSNTYNVTYHNKISYNTSWTEDHANSLYAQIGVGGNLSFNQTLTGLLYYPLSLNPSNYLTNSYNVTYHNKPSNVYNNSYEWFLNSTIFEKYNSSYLTNSYNVTYHNKPNNIYNASYEWWVNTTIFMMYNSSYLTNSYNVTYHNKPDNTYNVTYNAKPSNTYNVTYDSKPSNTYNVTYHGLIGSIKSGSNISTTNCSGSDKVTGINNVTGQIYCGTDLNSGSGSADYTNIVYTNKTNFITQPQIINKTLNVNNGTNILYRCLSATSGNTLPVGALTINYSNCGSNAGSSAPITEYQGYPDSANDHWLNYEVAGSFVPNATGNVLSVGCLWASTNAGVNTRYAVYDSDGTKPRNNLGETSSTAVTSTWLDINMTGITFMNGTQYWIAMQTSSNAIDNRERVGGIGYYKGSFSWQAFEQNATMTTVAGVSITCRVVYNGGSTGATTAYADTGLRVS